MHMVFLLQLLAAVSANPATVSDPPLHRVSDIPVPAGFVRMRLPEDDFGTWLRSIPLKRDKTVYLYNGTRKWNQSAQYAVIDMTVGKRDLQQCADAAMRLRAEYLLSRGRSGEIVFFDNNSTAYRSPLNPDRPAFEKYLEKVFAWCGTLSLERQLRKVSGPYDILPGDVFIRGGSPGHAVTVMDVAVSKRGEKVFLLSQSYMPAQDIHILVNPGDDALSPWYRLEGSGELQTPEWSFTFAQRKRW